MKTIKIIAYVALLTAFLSSCSKDETKTYLSDEPTAPVLSAPANNLTIVMDPADSLSNFETFTWSPAAYGFQSATQYLLQFSSNADMSAAQTLASLDLNSTSYVPTNLAFVQFLLSKLYLTPKVASTLYYRVVAYVPGLPKATFPAGGAVTATNTMIVTPFDTPVSIETWGIVGSATPNGWDGPDFVLQPTGTENQYAATVTLIAGEIKFRFNNNWDFNLGGANGVLSQGGANIAIAEAGTYYIVVNIEQTGTDYSGTYTITLQ